MKIFYHKGNIHFEDFGGKNFVVMDGTAGKFCKLVMEAALAAEDDAVWFWICRNCEKKNGREYDVCWNCEQPRG